MSQPKLSIIIPALNEEIDLPRLLQDLTDQTFAQFEVIVVDGQSTDQTVSKAKEFNQLNLQVIISDKANVSYQRNLGAKHANADWLIFFDADNQLDSNYLNEINKKLPSAKFDGFTTLIKPDSKNPQDILIAVHFNFICYALNQINQPVAFGACIGMRRQVFEAIGGFDEQLTFQEDVEVLRRLIKHGYQFAVFVKPIYTYSFRRFRAHGTLNLIRQTVPLQFKNMVSNFNVKLNPDDYPMLGGAYHHLNQDKESLNQQLKNISSKQISRLKQIYDKLRN